MLLNALKRFKRLPFDISLFLVFLGLHCINYNKIISMLIRKFTNSSEQSSLLVQKPVNKIVIVEKFDPNVKRIPYPQKNIPFARVRLVDGSGGASSEVVPKTLLSHLSEISANHEGFDVRAGSVIDSNKDERVLAGRAIYTIILGAYNDAGRFSCVDLSNQKYFDLELTGLNPDAEYEIYGIEGFEVSSFCRKYSQMFLSRDEYQKNILIGDNEVLVVPLLGLDEIQFYPINGRSFTMTSFELEHYAYTTNDIALVDFARGIQFNTDASMPDAMIEKDSVVSFLENGVAIRNTSKMEVKATVAGLSLGYEDLVCLDVSKIQSIDVRRNPQTASKPYTFYLIDTVATEK